MSVNSCSIKYLDKAYIGASVRLTGGSKTVKFDNKPMTGLTIEKYTKQAEHYRDRARKIS